MKINKKRPGLAHFLKKIRQCNYNTLPLYRHSGSLLQCLLRQDTTSLFIVLIASSSFDWNILKVQKWTWQNCRWLYLESKWNNSGKRSFESDAAGRWSTLSGMIWVQFQSTTFISIRFAILTKQKRLKIVRQILSFVASDVFKTQWNI